MNHFNPNPSKEVEVNGKRYRSMAEAVEILGISWTRLYRMLRRGQAKKV